MEINKVVQVGEEKIAVINVDRNLTIDDYGRLKEDLLRELPGYKVCICELMDIDFGTIARERLDDIHTRLHKALGIDLSINHFE